MYTTTLRELLMCATPLRGFSYMLVGGGVWSILPLLSALPSLHIPLPIHLIIPPRFGIREHNTSLSVVSLK